MDLPAFEAELRAASGSIRSEAVAANRSWPTRSDALTPAELAGAKLGDVVRAWLPTSWGDKHRLFPLKVQNDIVPTSAECCPTTCSLLEHARVYEAAFMHLAPGGRVVPHRDRLGTSDGFLNCQLCLTGTGRLYVGWDAFEQTPGRSLTYDGSTPHAAFNCAADERLVLTYVWRL